MAERSVGEISSSSAVVAPPGRNTRWLVLALLTVGVIGSVWTLDHLYWVDLALGPAIACLLAALATGRAAALLNLLDSRPIRSLGTSSYSLYLTHAPIVVIVYERIVAGRISRGVPAPRLCAVTHKVCVPSG